jgi:hypothetical protein
MAAQQTAFDRRQVPRGHPVQPVVLKLAPSAFSTAGEFVDVRISVTIPATYACVAGISAARQRLQDAMLAKVNGWPKGSVHVGAVDVASCLLSVELTVTKERLGVLEAELSADGTLLLPAPWGPARRAMLARRARGSWVPYRAVEITRVPAHVPEAELREAVRSSGVCGAVVRCEQMFWPGTPTPKRGDWRVIALWERAGSQRMPAHFSDCAGVALRDLQQGILQVAPYAPQQVPDWLLAACAQRRQPARGTGDPQPRATASGAGDRRRWQRDGRAPAAGPPPPRAPPPPAASPSAAPPPAPAPPAAPRPADPIGDAPPPRVPAQAAPPASPRVPPPASPLADDVVMDPGTAAEAAAAAEPSPGVAARAAPAVDAAAATVGMAQAATSVAGAVPAPAAPRPLSTGAAAVEGVLQPADVALRHIRTARAAQGAGAPKRGHSAPLDPSPSGQPPPAQQPRLGGVVGEQVVSPQRPPRRGRSRVRARSASVRRRRTPTPPVPAAAAVVGAHAHAMRAPGMPATYAAVVAGSPRSAATLMDAVEAPPPSP